MYCMVLFANCVLALCWFCFICAWFDCLGWVATYSGCSDYGTPDYECRYCHAMFWLHECVKSESSVRGGKIVYNKCCRGGKVVLPPLNSVLSQLHRWLDLMVTLDANVS